MINSQFTPPRVHNFPQILFTSDKVGGHHELFLRKTDDAVLQLTSSGSYDSWWGKFSPDYTKILFQRTPVGIFDTSYANVSIWTMNPDGSGLTELRAANTDSWELQGHVEWSPDGTKILIVGNTFANPKIYTISPSTGAVISTITDGIDPSYSPDGNNIVFVKNNILYYTTPGSGPEIYQLLNTGLVMNDIYYSPDGTMLAWIVETKPNHFAPGVGVWRIFVSGPDGVIRAVTEDDVISSKPEWAADSKSIFFHRLDYNGGTPWTVHNVHPDGFDLINVMPTWAYNAEYPDI